MTKPKQCPQCGATMTFTGSAGITLHGVEEVDDWTLDTNEDRQADRYDCAAGHTAFVLDTVDVPSEDEPEREKGDDDGVEYADPRDEQEDRRNGD